MNEQTLLLWGFGLMAVALTLVVLEVFIPSGGLIGVTAFVVGLGAIVCFWRVSWMWGSTSILVMAVLAPTLFNFGLRIMPHTPMGKHLILSEPRGESERLAAAEQKRAQQEQALVGVTGVAKTDLRPIGQADIEGEMLEVLAEGGVIDAGERIRVTSVSGNQVKVRRIV